MVIELQQRSVVYNNGSFSTSIPKVWAKNVRLQKKDKLIAVIDDNGNLVLSKKHESASQVSYD